MSTLIDIGALKPHFESTFGDPGVLREWFGQLDMYSMTVTLSGNAQLPAPGVPQPDVMAADLIALAQRL
jgi:hypothetical protein